MKTKATKQLEAKERKKVHDSLSTLEKIALAASRRGDCRKEIYRLTKSN